MAVLPPRGGMKIIGSETRTIKSFEIKELSDFNPIKLGNFPAPPSGRSRALFTPLWDNTLVPFCLLLFCLVIMFNVLCEVLTG